MMGLLIAMNIVLTRVLSFSAWNARIGFGFVPIVIAAVLFGPIPAGIVAALSDILGATLFPVGPYFPGFTLTAFLIAVVYGLFLYNKKHTMTRIALAIAVTQLLFSFALNTVWISILYSTPIKALFAIRITQTAILIPVQIAVVSVMLKSYGHLLARRAVA